LVELIFGGIIYGIAFGFSLLGLWGPAARMWRKFLRGLGAYGHLERKYYKIFYKI
jgi:hypothetical protein